MKNRLNPRKELQEIIDLVDKFIENYPDFDFLEDEIQSCLRGLVDGLVEYKPTDRCSRCDELLYYPKVDDEGNRFCSGYCMNPDDELEFKDIEDDEFSSFSIEMMEFMEEE